MVKKGLQKRGSASARLQRVARGTAARRLVLRRRAELISQLSEVRKLTRRLRYSMEMAVIPLDSFGIPLPPLASGVGSAGGSIVSGFGGSVESGLGGILGHTTDTASAQHADTGVAELLQLRDDLDRSERTLAVSRREIELLLEHTLAATRVQAIVRGEKGRKLLTLSTSPPPPPPPAGDCAR
ncbi:hypothetical protein T492DRAFT_23741 [Pavlovales sp. CCMP2436]|nr:hypothetical protein T492DRAFT_23741 [Pavlovales sp. CCMP2436]